MEDFKELKEALFGKNGYIKRAAISYGNDIMSSSYGQDLEVIHWYGERKSY